MNLIAGWNALVAHVPDDVLAVSTMAGVAIIVFSVLSYMWGNRDPRVSRRFSWGTLGVGLVLSALRVTVPLILLVVQTAWNLVAQAVTGG